MGHLSQSTRRHVLTTSSALGVGSIAGCGDRDASDTGQNEQPAGATAGGGTDPTPQQQADPTKEFDYITVNQINATTYVSTDDDLASILNAAESNDTFLLEPGTHELSETVRPGTDINYVTIRGHSMFNTFITRSGDFRMFELHGDDSNYDGKGLVPAPYQWTFEQVQIKARSGTEDLIHTRYGDEYRFLHCKFEHQGGTGNTIFVEQGWDWKFFGCNFDYGGIPERDTADVYLYNGDYDNTNHLRFTQCKFEKVSGHAIYGDNSGDGSTNGRVQIDNCKFHGPPPTETYYIAGDLSNVIVGNSYMAVGKGGYINVNGNSLLLDSNKIYLLQGGGPMIVLDGKEAVVSNNSFYSSGVDTTVAANTHEAVIEGNHFGGAAGRVEVNADRVSVAGNTLEGSSADAVDVDANAVAIDGNLIRNPSRHGIALSGRKASITGNVVQGTGSDGIHLAGAQQVTVGNNTTRECGSAGIRIDSDSRRIALTGNVDVDSADGAWTSAGQDVTGAANLPPLDGS
jgi:hypothetical protein